jgi:hypothetical protein
MKLKNTGLNKGFNPMSSQGPISITPTAGDQRNNGVGVIQFSNNKMNKGSSSGDRAAELTKNKTQ